MEKQGTVRRYYLDWVRVLVILTVFVYHSTRFFNLGDWSVKNPAVYGSVELFEQVLATWMMPLCFIVSGAAVFYALGKGSAGSFIKDKLLRLCVPLFVGIFTHSAWQVYLERVSQGGFTGSFFDFYPLYFDGVWVPASYANFYIANGTVLVPTFNDINDRKALGILSECFPDRDVVGIHAVDLVWGFGTLHCLTHEQPATGHLDEG